MEYLLLNFDFGCECSLFKILDGQWRVSTVELFFHPLIKYLHLYIFVRQILFPFSCFGEKNNTRKLLEYIHIRTRTVKKKQ